MEEYQQQLEVIENALKTSKPGPERDELLSLKENIEELLLLTQESLQAESRNFQLNVIENALKTSKPGPERDELLSLKANIEELQSLTRETLKAEPSSQGSSHSREDSSNSDGNCTDDEWALFMSEMAEEGAIETKKEDKYVDEKKIKELEGQKCQAPYKQQWGQMSYHNAMICSVPQGVKEMDNLQVKVLFLNPTHKEMLPCPYYFDMKKDCHYDEDSCQYSHGQLVNYSDLRSYMEPKFENLTIGSNVIAKQSDGIWYKGKITRMSKGNCMVKFESKSKNHSDIYEEINLEHVLHMEQDDDEGESDDCQIIHDEDEANEIEERKRHVKRAELINKSLMITPESKPLGEWEKHTKGIGSKLMQKMGYIVGTGLGKDGSGIVKPVSAIILPQGKSLDFCMNMKLEMKNPNLFHAETRTTKGKKKLKQRVQNKLERKRVRLEKMSLDKFVDFCIHHRGNVPVKSGQETQTLQEKLKNETDKNANLCLFKLDESLKKLKMQLREMDENIANMEQIHRIVPNKFYSKQKSKKNSIKRAELMRLILKNELDRRKTNKEMSVF
ncbi:zinc finger CCCH-type with G patch domain-containing protein [Anthonomus grandis grandis]|uniref:zinc finger CCCH-type with G patch domain-containing protein n=1 Tax=Anthonomus grandis grandis TaxID=2921223 RepID=UPI0021653C69|nr:zinc finger CCCH-type with G patch domain-containing protein [Anthonomus grandis grandis]